VPHNPIIQSQSVPSLGYQQTTVSELIRIAGHKLPADIEDAVAYVTKMPTTRDEAIVMLRNMVITAPPNASE
jgi:hypothetical protein